MYYEALLSGIGIQTALFMMYVYNSVRYVGIPNEKLLYYTTANIPCIAAILYSMALIQYGNHDGDPPAALLNYFFIEWLVTTPLLIINMGRVLHMKLYKYFILSSAAVGMNFFGYIAHNIPQPEAFGAFAAGGACYVFIMGSLTYTYYNPTVVGDTVTHASPRTPESQIALVIVKNLLRSIFSLWSAYPLVFLLYMARVMTEDSAIVTFVVLDIVSKGIFTSTLLGYYDHVNKHDSFLQYLIRSSRVVPLPQLSNHPTVGPASIIPVLVSDAV
jgi:bacteriorhodopsin